MKDLFSAIATNTPKIAGWATVNKALTLASIVIAFRPKIIVEIGVFGGRSLLPMALACKEINHGTVIGIDPYDRAASIESETKDNAEWWGRVDHEEVFRQFNKSVIHFGVDKFVTLLRKRSDDVDPGQWTIDLFHCDGSHTDQAVMDVVRYSPRVPVGGIVVMDDCSWTSGGVERAVNSLLATGFTELYRFRNETPEGIDDWAVFQKLK